MGATAIYTLPWPELTDVADGPASFQNLAQSLEDAIRSGACSLAGTTTSATTGNNDYVPNGSSREFNMGPINLPADAQTVLINTSICLDASQPGTFTQWAKWDGVDLYRQVYWTHSDDNTHDRLYSFAAAVSDQVAGNHTASLGFSSTAGQADVWMKNLSYSIVALG